MVYSSHYQYRMPEQTPVSPDFAVRINGEEALVQHLPVGSVVRLETDSSVDLEIHPTFAFESVVVRPLNRGIVASVTEGVVRLAVAPGTPVEPAYLSIEFDQQLRRPLFVLIDEPEVSRPNADDPNVVYLESGKLHEFKDLTLRDGQTLYLEGGAVLRGNIRAEEASDIAIRGRGVIDGSAHPHESAEGTRLIHLIACDDVVIEGVTILDGRNWQIMPCGCDRVSIKNVKIVSDYRSDDGIDLVGCRNVVVERCFIRTRDDCVAIKGFDKYHRRGGESIANIMVKDSVFWNAEWGNALEIGYETSVDEIKGVVFRNCDVIRCEAERFGSGGVLTIHNGDRARVSDVLYDEIRVEDAQEKLIDFKVCFDRYSRDETRGQIQGITVRNVHVVDGSFPVSILQGFGAENLVQAVTFENVRIHGSLMRDEREMRMIREKARDVRFVTEESPRH